MKKRALVLAASVVLVGSLATSADARPPIPPRVELFKACYDAQGVLIVGYNVKDSEGVPQQDRGFVQDVQILDAHGVRHSSVRFVYVNVKSASGGESYRRVKPEDIAVLTFPVAVRARYNDGTVRSTSDPRIIDRKPCTF